MDSSTGYVPSTFGLPTDPALIICPADAAPVKRLPRGAHACSRCKSRKQRCDPQPGFTVGKCTNCHSVGAECVFAPRTDRRPKKELTASSAILALSTPPAQASIPIPISYPSAPSTSQGLSWSHTTASSLSTSIPPPSYLDQHRDAAAAEPVRDGGSSGSKSESFSPSSREEGDAGNSDGEDEDGKPWSDAARGVAFLSLNASGSPIYVGPSSGFSWARVVLGGMAGAEAVQGQASSPTRHFPPHVINGSFHPRPSLGTPTLADDALASVSPEVAEMILSQCFRHIQPRHPFVDWLMVHEYWQNRDEIMHAAVQPGASKEARTGAFFIWMLFAVGTRLVQRATPPQLASPDAFYSKAMNHLEVIMGLHDLKNVQALMLMIMYSFRSAEAPSVWFLVGIVLRLCISLGLHRQLRSPRANSVSTYVLQLRSRLFWTSYFLDRMLAMSLGRPTGIADRDIDIDLPLDVDCVEPDPVLAKVRQGTSTSMSSSIHLLVLKRIESIIQKQVYRVDRPALDGPDELLRRLDEWEAAIPSEASSPTAWSVPCCSRDYFLMRGLEARLYLLRPLAVAGAEPRLIALLAGYAAAACETHKRLHQSPTWTVSLEALRTAFLDGLTLLHAARLDRNALPSSVLQRAIRANSNTVFTYIQHFPAAQSFHDAFEDLASRVLDQLATTPVEAPSGGVNLIPLPMATLDEVPWASSLLADMPNVMNVDFQDEYTLLLESLGIPLERLVQDHVGGEGDTLGGGSFGGYSDAMGSSFPNFF